MLRLKKGPSQPGPILSTLSIHFIHIFLLNNFSLRDPIYIRPRFFYFHDPILRLLSATHLRDPHSRPTFATHVRDSTRDSHLRPTFATPLTTPVRDSQSRPQPCLTIFCRDFRRATPPLTDGLC